MAKHPSVGNGIMIAIFVILKKPDTARQVSYNQNVIIKIHRKLLPAPEGAGLTDFSFDSGFLGCQKCRPKGRGFKPHTKMFGDIFVHNIITKMSSKKELDFILHEWEGLKIEFKESLSNLDKELVAFANLILRLTKPINELIIEPITQNEKNALKLTVNMQAGVSG